MWGHWGMGTYAYAYRRKDMSEREGRSAPPAGGRRAARRSRRLSGSRRRDATREPSFARRGVRRALNLAYGSSCGVALWPVRVDP